MMKFLCTGDTLLQVNHPTEIDDTGKKRCIINLRAKEGQEYKSSYDLAEYCPEFFTELNVNPAANIQDEVKRQVATQLAAAGVGPADEPVRTSEAIGPTRVELQEIAKGLGVANAGRMNKTELQEAIEAVEALTEA